MYNQKIKCYHCKNFEAGGFCNWSNEPLSDHTIEYLGMCDGAIYVNVDCNDTEE